MAVVRVIIWDEENFLQRISVPEDCFLIETIDASGSDENIIKIGPFSASSVVLGRENVSTFVSGVLSGSFITGTFFGDGSQLRGVVHQLNLLTGSFEIVAGPNTTVTTDNTTFPVQIVISSSAPPTGSDEKVKVSANDTTTDYLFSKLVAGPNIVLTEANDGSDEKVVISGTATGGGLSASQHRDLDQLVHNISENSYDEYSYILGSRVSNVVTWESSAKIQKVRELDVFYVGNTNKLSSSILKQYNSSGFVVEKITEFYTYVTGSKLFTTERFFSASI